MHCDYQTFFIVLVGTTTSQYLVWQWVKNQLCLQYLDFTLQTIWQTYYQDVECQNYDLWKQNSVPRISKRLKAEQQNLVWLFYLWNIMWIILLCFCLPRVWALSLVSVTVTYGVIVLSVSFFMYRYFLSKLASQKQTYLPNFYTQQF